MERYEVYKDSGIEWIGEIPAEWGILRLKRIATYSRGTGIQRNDVIPMGRPCVRYGELYTTFTNRVDSPVSFISDDLWNKSTLVFPDDLIMALTGETKEDIGPTCVNVSGTAFAASGDTLVIRSQNCDGRFLAYSMNSCYFSTQKYLDATGEIIVHLGVDKVGNELIVLPPLECQHVISDFLDKKTAEIDALVADCEREVELLREYRKAVISEAVTKGLDLDAPMKDSGIEWIGEMPEEWGCENLGGHSWMLTPMRDKPEDLNGPIPWVRIEDYDGKYISASKEGLGVSISTVEEMNLKVYPVGTLLCTSSCDLGKCAIVAKELVSNQRFIGIIPTSYDVEYLYFLMLSNAERLNFLSTGTIQANLSRKSFEHLKLPYPPMSEQKRIATYLDAKTAEIDSLIEAKQSMADKLREYRRSLIFEVVTGKFKVPGV